MARNNPFRHSNTVESPERLLDLAAFAAHANDRELTDGIVERLCAADGRTVIAEAVRRVRERVAAAWNTGWQPGELVRHVRRTADASALGLALVAIAADHSARDPSTLDARWVAQLTALDLPAVAPGDAWFGEWARREPVTSREQIRLAVAVLQSLHTIAPIPILIPPPGAGSGRGPVIDLTTKADDPMLTRVRALLAQAESTNFEAEAETFTAKAQELMTRHAIDMAMVSSGTQRGERPETIRIPIDDPYVGAKSVLLQFVASSSRCRAVFHKRFAMSSVVGFVDDLNATETLFTSLLVQAQVAMNAASSSAPPDTRTRSRGFRSSFLMAYAYRVAERLEEINAYVVANAEAETGCSIVPVLDARSSVVDAAVSEMFGRLRTTSSRRGLDPAGWASGRMAADRAKLNSGDLARPVRAISAPSETASRP